MDFRKIKLGQKIIIGYLTYIILGSIFLQLPITHSNYYVKSNFIDSIFMATSAISTTGLSVKSLSEYNFFGQLIILGLIQIGGLGYMTLGSYFTTKIRGNRFHKKQSSIISFSLENPSKINNLNFVKYIFMYTLIVETITAILIFLPMQEKLSNPSFLETTWYAIFHSISAFCTAGFSLFDSGLFLFSDSVYTQIIFIITMFLGGLGFIFASDTYLTIKNRQIKYSFTSFMILFVILIFIFINSIIAFVTNFNINLVQSIFISVSSITGAGFSTVSLNNISNSLMVSLMILMFIGAAPSGTGGGIKITTFTTTLATIRSNIKGEEYAKIFNQIIPKHRTRKAIAIFITYIAAIITMFLFIFLFQDELPFKEAVFEIVSAIGTVGFSMNLTPKLNLINKLLISMGMFIGRVGVITIMVYLVRKQKSNNSKSSLSDITV